MECAKAKQSFYAPITLRQAIKCAKAKQPSHTPQHVHLPFPTKIKSHCKLDRISSVPSPSSHFILPLQNKHAIKFAKAKRSFYTRYYTRFFVRKIGYINFVPKSVHRPSVRASVRLSVCPSVRHVSCNCIFS